jgi:hypothetical protein
MHVLLLGREACRSDREEYAVEGEIPERQEKFLIVPDPRLRSR